MLVVFNHFIEAEGINVQQFLFRYHILSAELENEKLETYRLLFSALPGRQMQYLRMRSILTDFKTN